MKLKAIDQIHVSSVRADSLRPGEEFEVSDDLGKDLLRRHPKSVSFVEVEDEADEPAREKAEQPLANKSEPAPLNKISGRKRAAKE